MTKTLVLYVMFPDLLFCQINSTIVVKLASENPYMCLLQEINYIISEKSHEVPYVEYHKTY